MWNPFRKSIGKLISEKRKGYKIATRSINDLQSEDLVKKWSARPVPPVNFTDRSQTKLVGRMREICLNNSHGKAALRIMKHNVVGEHGVRLQSHVKLMNGKLDMKTNDAIEEAWKDFSKAMYLDTAELSNLQEYQELCLTSMVTDGDFFVQIHEDDEYEHGIKIQIIDAMRIPPSSSSRYRRAESTEVYKNGILFDKITGKPKQYSLNEDDIIRYDVDVHSSADWIEAKNMLHGFIKEQVGQARGLPLGQTAAETLYMIGKYAEAALQNARVGASKVGFLRQSDMTPEAITYKTDENGDVVLDADDNPIPESAIDKSEIDLTPGSMNMLPPGFDLSAWSPEYPNNEFEGYMRTMLQFAAMGFSVPYADLSGDLTSVNYSSIRQGALEVRENYKMLQGILVNKFLDPLFKRWLIAAIMKGRIMVGSKPLMMDKINDYCKPVWTPKRWAWIDPKSEASANQMAVKTGLKAPSQIIKEMGGDPEEVWETMATDWDTMIAKGVHEEIVAGIFAQNPATVEEILGKVMEGNADGTSAA